MKRIKLHWWIILGMVVGAILGAIVHSVYVPTELVKGLDPTAAREAIEKAVKPTAAYRAFDGVATIFLNLLKMIVVPLVFFSLISGLLGMGNLAQLGRIGIKTFVFYIVTSLLAILTGLAIVNAVGPGVGVDISIPKDSGPPEDAPNWLWSYIERLNSTLAERGIDVPLPEAGGPATPESFWDVLVAMVPQNVVQAAAEFDLLGVIIFAIFFGAFLLTLKGARRDTVVTFVEAVSEIMMKMTGFIISLAPIGIAALIASMVSATGLVVFWKMKWYVICVLGALGCHLLVTLPILIFLLTRRNPYRYLRAMMPALLTGFSTASSSGTLAVTMERAEAGAGVSNRVASFVLPLGATINMDGTALYEIVSVLFIAQIHAGIDPDFTLTIGQQLLIVFLGLTVSIGAAGIPHAGLVMMVIILNAVGLPVEYTALIWAVDRPLDMCRTAVNIASDSSITLVMAHSEKEIDESVLWNRGPPPATGAPPAAD